MKFIIFLLCAGLSQARCSKKLPFIPPPEGSDVSCPRWNETIPVYKEVECGTKRFCRAIQVWGLNSTEYIFDPKPKWDNMDACFEAHEREPERELLPFRFPTEPLDVCLYYIDQNEECYGTNIHCKNVDEMVASGKARTGRNLLGEGGSQGSDIRWLSTDECFKAHVPEPKDLPFLEGNPDKPCGTDGDESEETCGTEAFCNQFSSSLIDDEESRHASGSPYFWNKKQCLAAHQKKPAAAAC
ncbi:hypothetical protein MY3296_007563 [Beauveria thailandica]